MLWKCCTQYASKIQQWPQDWKRSVFISVPKKGNAKECSNYHTIAHITHISKVILKILQLRDQWYMNGEFPDVEAGFRKGRGTRSNFQHLLLIKKARIPEKTSTSASLTTLKPLTVCITTNCGKFFKRWDYQTTLPALWEIDMQIKKHS